MRINNNFNKTGSIIFFFSIKIERNTAKYCVVQLCCRPRQYSCTAVYPCRNVALSHNRLRQYKKRRVSHTRVIACSTPTTPWHDRSTLSCFPLVAARPTESLLYKFTWQELHLFNPDKWNLTETEMTRSRWTPCYCKLRLPGLVFKPTKYLDWIGCYSSHNCRVTCICLNVARSVCQIREKYQVGVFISNVWIIIHIVR